jgi:hypothetical protein
MTDSTSTPKLSPKELVEKSVAEGKAFIKATRQKMDQLVGEFADGKLNRDQFQTLYDRYQSQINGVQAVLHETDPSSWTDMLDGEKTFNIRKRLMAKALGMAIYNDKTGVLLETLGDFSVDPLRISQLMLQLSDVKTEVSSDGEKERPQIVAELETKEWIFLAKGDYTTVVIVFSREPTTPQIETIVQILQDFEKANVSQFTMAHVTADQFAMPFRTLIKNAGKK